MVIYRVGSKWAILNPSLENIIFAHVIFLTHHVKSPTLTHKNTAMSSIELFDNQSDDSLSIGEQLSHLEG